VAGFFIFVTTGAPTPMHVTKRMTLPSNCFYATDDVFIFYKGTKANILFIWKSSESMLE